MPLHAFEHKESVHRHLHTFCIRPDIRFDSQHDDEEVLLVLRAHPITLIPWIITSIILVLVPPFINLVLSNFFSLKEIFFIDLIWYSFVFSYAFINLLLWIFNVGIVTNYRMIDVDYPNILIKEETGSSIEDATDLTAQTTGFIRALFHYGDIYIQTAGIMQNIEFLKVPDPDNVVSIINRLMRPD